MEMFLLMNSIEPACRSRNLLLWKRTIDILLLILLAAGISLSASAASFDCRKATSFSEKLICAEPEASALDKDIAVLYRGYAIDNDDWPDIKGDQVRWLKTRNACEDRACVYKAMQDRRLALMRDADAFASYEKHPRGVTYHILAGTRGGKLEWLIFVSWTDRFNDCAFALTRHAGKLEGSEGLMFSLVDIPGGFAIHPAPESAAQLCGGPATLPGVLRVVKGNIYVD